MAENLDRGCDRRHFLGVLGAGGVALGVTAAGLAGSARAASAEGGGNGSGGGNGGGGGTGGGSGTSTVPTSVPRPTTKTRVVRLVSVVTPIEGGLYEDLLPDFEQQSGYSVKLTGRSPDVFGPARAGKADIVISHYGHKQAEGFVQDGHGSWPQTVFFNPMAFLGPPDDPAQIRGLTDAAEAFRRIATAKSPFIINNIEGVKYLTNILWNAAGQPDRTGWYRDQGLRERAAIDSAAQQSGYTFWGLTPFLTAQKQRPAALVPLVLEDPLLQRIMVTIRVLPNHHAGINTQGAEAFQQYLLQPRTQARIRAFRYPGIDQQIWWPAGRNNASVFLPQP
jgi:tungstate transport system substrate-binding protein